MPVQAKLQVGQPNDRYEQEADQMVSAMVGHSQTQAVSPTSGPMVQRAMDDKEGLALEENEEEEAVAE